MTLHRLLLVATLLAAPGMAVAAPVLDEPPASYAVKPGDTLYELGARYLTRLADVPKVQRLNRIANPRRLPIGRTLSVPVDLLRSEPVIAHLIAYSGPVTVSGIGAGTLRTNMEIREGFGLTTGANAFLTFELPDGSRTTLPSQSRIRIERLRRILLTGAIHRDFRLEEGRSTSVVSPQTDPASRFRILTPLTVAAVRGTEFRVNHDSAAGRSTLEVIEGKVADTDAQSELLVAAGYGATATASGLSAPQALLPAPSLLSPGKLQDDPETTFEVKPLAGGAAYRAQIATDAGFIDVVAETTADGPRLTFAGIKNGAFFARFTALSAEGLEGLPETYAFERRLNAVGMEPPATIAGAKRQYLFKWRTPGDAPESYRFMLSRQPDGTGAVIDELGLNEKQIVVTDLPPGVYYWRVLITRREDGRVFEKWSPPQRFNIGG